MNRFVRALLNYFIKGVLVVVPLGAAVMLIYWVVSSLDQLLNLSGVIWVDPKTGLPVYIPGLGILTVLVIILFAGIVVTNFITEPIKNWANRWLNRLPLFNFLYSSIKDLTEAFVGDEKKFHEPVIVEINNSGYKQVGFVTQKDLSRLDLEGEVAVYFPFSYSFAGQLAIVSAEKVRPLDLSASEAMKFVVSGGVSGLDKPHSKQFMQGEGRFRRP
ncbi:DUF502 domain-containing protein [Arcticibacter tournemirensis]|uniref:DUF502 domain-containing protein n=1 Tax=Arcticibacter tournemirensis TaxID=699437 RepID=A0A4Q0M2M6_9SPHI|nr:DUF502 domain-containing protein [Arcticibacter tournemirensis]RXF67084.1 DUF502 domain-containing protein [Arcticibacter tournemirensis]